MGIPTHVGNMWEKREYHNVQALHRIGYKNLTREVLPHPFLTQYNNITGYIYQYNYIGGGFAILFFALAKQNRYNQLHTKKVRDGCIMSEIDYLSDSTENTTTRFVTLITPKMNRFDLVITTTNRFYGKKLVTDMQQGITAVIGPDDLDKEGYIEELFRLDEEQAEELTQFLEQIVGPVNFNDF